MRMTISHLSNDAIRVEAAGAYHNKEYEKAMKLFKIELLFTRRGFRPVSVKFNILYLKE